MSSTFPGFPPRIRHTVLLSFSTAGRGGRLANWAVRYSSWAAAMIRVEDILPRESGESTCCKVHMPWPSPTEPCKHVGEQNTQLATNEGYACIYKTSIGVYMSGVTCWYFLSSRFSSAVIGGRS